jgi:hypothetical protein
MNLYSPDCPPGSTPEQIAKPIRVVEVRTFPRMSPSELAELFGMPFKGEVGS